MAIEETIKQIVEKTGLKSEDVMHDYEEKLQEVKKMFPSAKEDSIKQKAEMKLLSFYRKILISNSYIWEGYVIQYDDANDRMANKRKTAEIKMRENRELAMKEGFCDSEGVILETNPKSKNFGKPLQPFIARNVMGICTTKGKEPKKFVMTFTAEQLAKIPVPPLHKPCKFKARLVMEDAEMYKLGSVTETKFEPATTQMPPIADIISKFYKKVSEITPELYGQEVVFEAIVDSLEIDRATSKVLRVSQENMGLNAVPITVFMPKQFNFNDVEGLGEQTKVLVWGRVNNPREDGTIAMNGTGLWVLPEWRVVKSPEVKAEEIW